MKNISSAFFVLVMVVLASCKNDKRNIKDYYFPTDELLIGKVYEYSSLTEGDSVKEYWYYRAFQRDSGLFLSATSYSRYFQIEQMVREKIVDNGSLARDLSLYEPNAETGQQTRIQAKIEASNVFPFEVKDSTGVFLYKLHYYLPQDSSSKIFLIRNRSFMGDAADFEFKGENHPCIRFRLREVFGSEGEGTAEGKAQGEEIYAKGIGLVQFRKSYGTGENESVRAYRLTDIFPMGELEKKAKLSYEQPTN